MTIELSSKQAQQLAEVVAKRGTGNISRTELLEVSKELYGSENALVWISRSAPKAGWGLYQLSALISNLAESVSAEQSQEQSEDQTQTQWANAAAARRPAVKLAEGLEPASPDSAFLPVVDKNYIQHENFKLVEPIIASGMFYPVFITGLSGNGKTTMVQQVCAKLKRELVRANITIETDEDDLLGGFRLVGGDTVWQDGPVIEAMKRGAVLLLDEVDLASNKIMCLQSVLEGKSIFLKKVNQVIEPAKGFTVLATANTKGKGDNSGGFVGTNILNEAFLDRFPITVYQDYPTNKQEIKILEAIRTSIGAEGDEDFVPKLVTWASNIRKAYEEESVSEIITTRRLINIVQAHHIFKDRKRSIELCIERFDEETKKAFLDFYKALDDAASTTGQATTKVTAEDVLAW